MTPFKNSPLPIHRYTAAGGVLVFAQNVLALDRPSRQEVRLPKGHVEVGETPAVTALREVREESGYTRLHLLADLGTQVVEFEYAGEHLVRTEHYFLMALVSKEDRTGGEAGFEPMWLSWDEALDQLTYEAERQWVQRAKTAFTALDIKSGNDLSTTTRNSHG